MKRYDSYKDSGVKWLGEIPSHWEMLALKHILKHKKEVVGKRSSQYDLLSLTLKGVIIRDMDNPEGKFPASFDTYQIVEPNDFIFCNFDNEETPRAVGLSQYKGMITGAYDVLYRNNPLLSDKYLIYYFLYIDDSKRFKPLYKGLRKTVPFDSFMSYKIPVPSRGEQDAVVEYLDSATSKIDEAIAQQQKMIDLLNERKQIIINNAVTKGLDPNVKMKPSGIDWIGQIPAHWNVAALKRYVKLTNGDRGPNYPSGDEIKDSGILFVTADNIHNLVLDITSSAKYITEEKYNTLRGAKMRIGDIIFCLRGAGFGNCAINNTFEEGTIASSLVCITPRYINGYFLNYVLHSEFIRIQEINSSNGSCADNVSAQDLGDYMIIIPPLNEQKQIVDHIAQFDTSIDSVINMASKQISLLQERKQIIINDVVTGKVKVV